jgi:hypothetical protein
VTTILVLVVTLALLCLVLFWSTRYGDRNRGAGTSLRRDPHAHTTARGRPKKGYTSREEAEAHAQRLSGRDGAAMNAYRCPTCTKWHVGHES